ncbi:hypothetical protein CON22_24790 [Bacillus cereus]|nr:hypothetical protein CON22_24790 [Bacillus cereus]
MRVHFIEDQDKKIAYFPDTKRFFDVNDAGKELIMAICSDENEIPLLKKFGLNHDEYTKYRENIEAYATSEYRNKNIIKRSNTLNRLAINITNSCNLRCKYCYANGGSYGSDSGVMKKKTLLQTLDMFFNKFEHIHNIQIFGGEPLVSMDNIETVCQYIKEKNFSTEKNTSVGLVTNGTLINERFIDLVNTYNIQVTVSFDGTEEVNDIMRIQANGQGTANIIINNIKKLQKSTSQPSTIEVTYNRKHVEHHVSIYNSIERIREVIGDTPIHLVPAGGNKEDEYVIEDLNIFIDSVDKIFEEMNIEKNNYSYSLVDRIINGLVTKNMGSSHICDAGVGTLSVSSAGDVYPCFMFTDDENLVLGNVNDDEDIFESPLYNERLKKMQDFNLKSNNEVCKKCFINTLCNGCLGLNALESNDPLKLSEPVCNMFKGMTEKVILNLSKNAN